MTNLTGQVALILIFKHAAVPCLSGVSPKLALTQAEADFQQTNIASKIEEQFSEPDEKYTRDQFLSFLLSTNIGLLSLATAKIISDRSFLKQLK